MKSLISKKTSCIYVFCALDTNLCTLSETHIGISCNDNLMSSFMVFISGMMLKSTMNFVWIFHQCLYVEGEFHCYESFFEKICAKQSRAWWWKLKYSYVEYLKLESRKKKRRKDYNNNMKHPIINTWINLIQNQKNELYFNNKPIYC